MNRIGFEEEEEKQRKPSLRRGSERVFRRISGCFHGMLSVSVKGSHDDSRLLPGGPRISDLQTLPSLW